MNAEYKNSKGKVLFFGKNNEGDYTLNIETERKTALGFSTDSYPSLTLADTKEIRFYEDA